MTQTPPTDRITDFGTLPGGRRVEAITLAGGGLRARVLTLGAIVQDLRLDSVAHPLVLGCETPEDYLGPGRYLGAIVGRYGNRIGGARMVLDGQSHALDANFLGRHTLHGGSQGTDTMVWRIETLQPASVTLSLTLPDGHMGFPGQLDITARIALADRTLRITLEARTDKATPCSLTHHGYFDLDGLGDIRGHRLRIAAQHYLPVDAELIPDGRILPVADTPFDFRADRPVGQVGALDHNFCLSDAPVPLRPVAWLTGRSGLSLEVRATSCGLQVYDGAHFDGMAGLGGRRYGPHAGIALEAQHWPDAPNRAGFPKAILHPGELWQSVTEYHLTQA